MLTDVMSGIKREVKAGRAAKTHSIAYVKLPVSWRNKLANGNRGLGFEASVAVTLMLEAEGLAKLEFKPGFEKRRDELATEYLAYLEASKAE